MAQIALGTTMPPALLRTQCPDATDISYRRLTCTTGGHNKYWEAWTCKPSQDSTAYYVYSRWGKIGSRSPGYRVGSYTNAGKASTVVQNKVREKLDKGYIIVETGAGIGSISAFLTGAPAGGVSPAEDSAETDRSYGRFRDL